MFFENMTADKYDLSFNNLTGALSCIRRLTDGACIPIDPDNVDYQKFMKWQNQQPPEKKLDLSPRPASNIEPVPTIEDRITRLEQLLEQYIKEKK